MSWTGVFPAATTKMTPDGQLDLDAMAVSLERLVAGGVSGIIVLPMLGENASLTQAEKDRVVSSAREVIAGRVPLLSGLAELSTADAIAAAKNYKKLGAEGLIYITCENSAKVAVIDPKTNAVIDAIDSGSTNGHRLCIPDDGRRLYTDNEEDATVSVIDVPNRKLLGKIATPEKLAGIAVAADGKTVVAVSDDSPVVFAIDTGAGKVVRTVPLEGVEKAAQIARYSPDGKLLIVSSLNSNKISIIDAATFGNQSAISVGSQPMDFAFKGDELFVGCQGDGTMHIIDLPGRRNTGHVKAGSGCESIGFF